MDPTQLIDSGDILLLIPFLVVIGWIVTAVLKHRERMATIERGMNPDQVRLDRERLEQRR